MNIFPKNIKQLLLSYLVLIIIGVSPILISMIGATLSEYFTGEICHEGNCAIAAIFWYAFMTIPLSVLLLIIITIIYVVKFINR